jgi:hypothetical protein
MLQGLAGKKGKVVSKILRGELVESRSDYHLRLDLAKSIYRPKLKPLG